MILPSIYFTLRSAEVRSTVTWCVMCVVLGTHCLDKGVERWVQLDEDTYNEELPKPYDSEKKNRQGQRGQTS